VNYKFTLSILREVAYEFSELSNFHDNKGTTKDKAQAKF